MQKWPLYQTVCDMDYKRHTGMNKRLNNDKERTKQ